MSSSSSSKSRGLEVGLDLALDWAMSASKLDFGDVAGAEPVAGGLTPPNEKAILVLAAMMLYGVVLDVQANRASFGWRNHTDRPKHRSSTHGVLVADATAKTGWRVQQTCLNILLRH